MSISDMMSGLMLVFLFIAIGFMIEVESEKEQIKDVAKEYRNSKANLNEILFDEFEQDLELWNATITKENTIVFDAPDVLFKINKSEIENSFKTILNQFCPRFISQLQNKKIIDEIKEVRVEGHTSNDWGNSTSTKEVYLNNMKLSQSRAYNVLSYCYNLNDYRIIKNRKWIEKFFRANGMAFSKLKENNSRRVEFTIELKSEDKIYKILK